MMKLSKRLEAVASFVRAGSCVADVGTDHGYVPIWLIRKKIAVGAIAMDVRTGPLERAAAHIREYGLENQIETRLSDGLEGLRAGEADTVVIAGMGGELVIRILLGGRSLWESISHWVLSPQSELRKVRHFLAEEGFCITEEAMIQEDGKYYTILSVQRGVMCYEHEAEYRYGKCLIDAKDPVLQEYLQKEERQLREILSGLETRSGEKAERRRNELSEELSVLMEAYHAM